MLKFVSHDVTAAVDIGMISGLSIWMYGIKLTAGVVLIISCI